MTFNDDLNEVLKYSRERLPVSAIHPELRFTRLGAVLREHATEPSDVGELAYQALTSDHSQSLDLMPLHLLRDKMQEEPEHPLAKRFNWSRLPEKVALDEIVDRLVRGSRQPFENYRDVPTRRQALQGMLEKEHEPVTDGELQDSVRRMNFKNDARLFGDISIHMPDGTVYPDTHSYLASPHYEDFRQRGEPVGTLPPDHY